MDEDYLLHRWRTIRKLGRADFVWRRRMLRTYLPGAVGTCVIVYLRAEGWTGGSSRFFWIAAGVAAFGFCFAFARGEWALREEQYRELCERRHESFDPVE